MTLRTRKNIGSTRAQQCTTVAAAVALALAASSAARAAQTVAAADTASEGAELSEVIVTGTRQGGLEAAESPAPVQILSSEALQTAAGNPDLMSVLAQLVPSLQMQAFGFDMAGQTLMARLRGMSPNHVLILVNGKRRHTSANIQVDAGSAFEGGANTDLNFIPVDAIDHIEVLTEGAAAQYGTDAIAGVINIILKKNTQGGTLTATDGRNYDDQGLTSDVSGNAGFGPDDNTYFDITGEVHNHGHTNHSGADPRAVNEATTYPNTNMLGLPGYPFLNHIEGDAETHTKLALINAGVGITPDIEAYTTMSYGYKEAASYENYRTPERISATVGGVTTYPFPFGFNPEEGTHETDYQGTFGFKGALDTWNWDLATSYGKDKVEEYTLNTIGNTYTDTTSPFYGDPTASNFYDGYLQASQWTTTLDLNRDFDVGMAGPLNVAVGGEYRRETYTIGAGVPGAYLSGGPQSFAGLAPTDAGSHDRTNEAVYVDLAGKPIENLRVDLAGRYEHYSDFGSAEVGKLTARYDFTPVIAARGTISNGFRAPTLAEEYFSSTNLRYGRTAPELQGRQAARPGQWSAGREVDECQLRRSAAAAAGHEPDVGSVSDQHDEPDRCHRRHLCHLRRRQSDGGSGCHQGRDCGQRPDNRPGCTRFRRCRRADICQWPRHAHAWPRPGGTVRRRLSARPCQLHVDGHDHRHRVDQQSGSVVAGDIRGPVAV
jgi:iron complex outermembrane recepter protein